MGKTSRTGRFRARMTSISALALVMVTSGLFSAYASANTYEAMANRDIPVSDVVESVRFTSDEATEDQLVNAYRATYSPGMFGTPEMIKLPEAGKHIRITPATYHSGQWKATKGIAHTFLNAGPRQKVFGSAFIYMRLNTLTTKNLGQVYPGDLVNIVTTQGWQLGYRVTAVGTDVSQLKPFDEASDSAIVVTFIDDTTGAVSCFIAHLSKVGDRT
ncbi:hypothetical protein FHR83_005023 [Actinoplanes campanulatus]|uniref:Sortase n=1 Tax=Actinoplanes campanulatus TaxID=113559 RepID=A0A7W5FGF3_9ACTN|nr:hypothetical protein [Actinoplanes campanulatus]MBB3097345.1 hypothetical protein [Actinoplanes campanulatus]GGN26355.1 hypothetical protein GCM10010109_43140 [Actinoplanes campanulatus]GID38193.1 hypothetical protein Aca09nite_46990 [Actinoplanes campanulatus]